MDTTNTAPVHDETTAPKAIQSPKKLLIDSWELFAKHWRTFFGIMLMVMLPILVLSVPAFFISMSLAAHEAVLFVIMLTLFLAVVYFCVWAYAAMITAVVAASKGESVKIVESYKKARPLIRTLLGVAILTALIVLGGTILFIIPGLVFAIWYNFSYFIATQEGIKGMAALKKSKAYVNGRFWPIAGRFGVLLLVGFAFSFVMKLVEMAFNTNLQLIGSLVNLAFNLAWTSYVVVYAFLLYRSVKETYVAPVSSGTAS